MYADGYTILHKETGPVPTGLDSDRKGLKSNEEPGSI